MQILVAREIRWFQAGKLQAFPVLPTLTRIKSRGVNYGPVFIRSLAAPLWLRDIILVIRIDIGRYSALRGRVNAVQMLAHLV